MEEKTTREAQCTEETLHWPTNNISFWVRGNSLSRQCGTRTHFLRNKCNAKRTHFSHVKTTTHSSFTALGLSVRFPLLVSSSSWHLHHAALKACAVLCQSSAVAGSLKSTWWRHAAVETAVGFPPQATIGDNYLPAKVPTISLLTEIEEK